VTAVTCLFIINKKENQKKRNIKSRKIDKKKRKMLVFKCIITVYPVICRPVYLQPRQGSLGLFLLQKQLCFEIV